MERVKIEHTEYDEKSNLIRWQVTLSNGKKADLVWHRNEFGPTFGISQNIPDKLLNEFNTMMIGKSVYLKIGE